MIPPVPLFHSVSTGNVNQQQHQSTVPKMFTSGNPEGSSDNQDTCIKFQKLIQRLIGDHTSDMPDFTEFVNDMPDDGQLQDFSFDSPGFENRDAPGNTSEPQTVSPQELLLDSMSAPPSATLTNLSTPGDSPWESPFFTNSTDASPVYGVDEIGETFDYPLFPDSGSLGLNDVLSSPRMEDLRPIEPQSRHSSIAGVNAKRRSKPLPPIEPGNPNDLASVKRARNTAAARKSRQKKTQLLEDLEGQVTELTNVNVHLQTENTRLKREAARWQTIALARGKGDQA